MPRSGLMCETSPDTCSLAKWASSLPDSHASRILEQGSGLVSRTLGIYGPTPLELSGMWDPSTCSWRMFEESSTARSHSRRRSLASFPRSGMTVYGGLHPLLPLVPHTVERDGGYWPTPNSSDALRMRLHPRSYIRTLENYAVRGVQMGSYLSRTLAVVFGASQTPHLTEWLMGLPIGWTALESLAMESYQSWLQSFRGDSCSDG